MANRTDQDFFLNQYQQGYVGLTATPGAGKTTTLIRLVNQLLERGVPLERILVLSYTRAASANFRERLLQAHPTVAGSSLENICTIHSCAYRLIQPYLTRWGYDNRPLAPVLSLQKKLWVEEIILPWLEGKENQWLRYLVPGHTPESVRLWRMKLVDLAEEGISLAKQQQISAYQLKNLSERYPERFFLNLTAAAFTVYQEQLRRLNLLDFDDMVNLAIELLTEEERVRLQWQNQYQYLLEDEAQDSTQAQHQLLSLLAGETGNWVRVGDPNQAIFSSFTAADPRFLTDFCDRYQHHTLNQASRSVEPVLAFANDFLDLVIADHPHLAARSAFHPQRIESTSDNPVPTPHSRPRVWVARDRTSENQEVLTRAHRYLKTYPEHSVAILTFSHRSLDDMAQILQQGQVPFVDYRQGQQGEFFKSLGLLVRWVYDPTTRLGDTWLKLGNFEQKALVIGLGTQIDVVVWFDGGYPWEKLPAWNRLSSADRLEFQRVTQALAQLYAIRGGGVVEFLFFATRCLDRTALPTVEQFARKVVCSGEAPTVGALAQFLVRQQGREFLMRSITAEQGEEAKGQIELCTLHSCKGREWDAVFITGVTDYWFPTDHEGIFQGQLDYLTIFPQAQLKSEFALEGTLPDFAAQVKDDIINERLRLLYVGLTRPRFYLSVSCHGQPALVFQWLEERQEG